MTTAQDARATGLERDPTADQNMCADVLHTAPYPTLQP